MAEHRAAPIRLTLVDAQPIFRSGLALLLQGMDEIANVAESDSPAVAAPLARNQRPHVVLLGSADSGTSLASAVQAMRAAAPDAAIALLVNDFDETIFAAVRAGALGCFHKSADLEQIRDGIRRVASGGAAVTPVLAGRMLEEFERLGALRSGEGAHRDVLSHREAELLRCLRAGWRDEEIAAKLEILPHMTQRLLRATLDVLHHLSPGGNEDGGDFSGDRAPRPRPGGSPVRVASVALPLPEPEQTPLPDWLVRAFPEGFEPT